MTKVIEVLNGPNLNLLGEREPEIYGRTTLAAIEEACRREAEAHGRTLEFRQSNAEHDLVDWIQAARDALGIVINPAAFSYSGYAILDALKACSCPVIEVHLSNIHRREAEWRARSIITQGVTGVISGLGADGYVLAVRQLARLSGSRGS